MGLNISNPAHGPRHGQTSPPCTRTRLPVTIFLTLHPDFLVCTWDPGPYLAIKICRSHTRCILWPCWSGRVLWGLLPAPSSCVAFDQIINVLLPLNVSLAGVELFPTVLYALAILSNKDTEVSTRVFTPTLIIYTDSFTESRRHRRTVVCFTGISMKPA